VLLEDWVLILKLIEAFENELQVKRGPAWWSRVKIAMFLQGIYVRDIKSGKVRAVIDQTYILNQNEELWDKPLPSEVEKLLTN
jgi:hypothetical protein